MSQEIKGKVAVFDVEGVLIPKNRYFFELAKNKSYFALIKVLIFGFFYGLGVLKLEPTLRRIFRNLKGTKISTMERVFDQIPATPQLRNFMEELKLRNFKIILISSGLPTFLVKKFGECIGADDAYGIDLEVQGEAITGKISGEAIEPKGKLKICSRILNIQSAPPNNVVVVADDRNNSCLFLPNVMKIGFNPDFMLRVKADFVVCGRLASLLPVIDGQPAKWHFPSKNDLIREDIHASGFFVPVIASLITVPAVAIIITAIAIVYLASELSRLENKKIPLISAITRNAASQTELHGFVASPLYFAFGIVLTLILFPFSTAGAAIAMFAFGDSSASILGGIWGKRLPFNKGKTLDGALAGFFFAFLAGTFFVSPLYALAGAAFAMTIEALPLPINDNIVIPVLTGLFLTLII